MKQPHGRLSGYWPPVLLLLAVLVSGAIILTGEPKPLRMLSAFWIVAYGPGNAVVRLLQTKDGTINLALSIALSLSLSTCISLFMIYTHTWSLINGVICLLFITCLASLFEVILVRTHRIHSPNPVEMVES